MASFTAMSTVMAPPPTTAGTAPAPGDDAQLADQAITCHFPGMMY
jgi:hypothetical protein